MLRTLDSVVEAPAAVGAASRTSAVSHLPTPGPTELSFLLGILSCAREAKGPTFPPHADAALLWEYIERHGIGGVLGACVERVAGLPPAMAEAARHRYWSNCLYGKQARQRCAALLKAGQREGVTVFFVKGPALIDQGYVDDGMRGFSDLDLFTSSADEARRLAGACGARTLIDSEKQSICREIGDSGRLVAELEGWPVEIRFPIAGWEGPLFDLFPNGRLPKLVVTANDLQVPNVEWHFLFLLHHLMMHHFFGRLIWFLDLAVLVRRERAGLDWEWILAESKRLAIQEALAAAARFCRRYVDPEFPEVPSPSKAAWNRPFLDHLVKPLVVISSGRNKQQVSAARRGWAMLHGAASYLLLADAPCAGRLCDGRGGQWTEARVRCVLTSRWKGKWGRWFGCRLSALAPWIIYPLARLLAWIPTRRQSL